MLDTLLGYLSLGWVGTLIGLLGIGIAVYQTFRRSDAIPAFQYTGQRLISSGGGLLPNEVAVQFNGMQVPRISLTYVVFWNRGPKTLKGSDIVSNHPLLIKFENCQVLKAEIIKSTRSAIEASATPATDNNSDVRLNFAFLDANDGFTVKVLHTSTSIKPTIEGTIMGVPKGVTYLGRAGLQTSAFDKNSHILHLARKSSRSWPGLFVLLAIGIFGISSAVYPDFLRLAEYNPEYQREFTRFAMALMGLMYIGMSIFVWKKIRRRFPNSLNFEGS